MCRRAWNRGPGESRLRRIAPPAHSRCRQPPQRQVAPCLACLNRWWRLRYSVPPSQQILRRARRIAGCRKSRSSTAGGRKEESRASGAAFAVLPFSSPPNATGITFQLPALSTGPNSQIRIPIFFIAQDRAVLVAKIGLDTQAKKRRIWGVAVMHVLPATGAVTDRPILVGIARRAAQSPQLAAKRSVEFFSPTSQSILNRCPNPRLPFRWTINPYRGCELGCKHCYARYTHEFMGLGNPAEFEEKIYSKERAGEILKDELRQDPGGSINSWV